MRKLISVFAYVIFLAGCATGSGPGDFRVAVSSLATPNAAAYRTYVLWSADPELDAGDLQFQEFAKYIEHVLHERGFVPAVEDADADVAILLGYGIGDPRSEQYSYAVPTFGQTGVASASTFGNTTYFNPSFGVTGYVPVTGSVTTYTRHFWLSGYDFEHYRKTEEAVQIWETSVTSTGTSGDLRRVFPVMVAAAKPFVATNTRQQVEISLPENSAEVVAVKNAAQRE